MAVVVISGVHEIGGVERVESKIVEMEYRLFGRGCGEVEDGRGGGGGGGVGGIGGDKAGFKCADAGPEHFQFVEHGLVLFLQLVALQLNVLELLLLDFSRLLGGGAVSQHALDPSLLLFF